MLDQYTLTMAPVGSGSTLPPEGVHNYPACTTVNLYAIAEGDGWIFENWSGSVADADNSSTIIAMTGDQSITANFKQAVTLTVELQGTGSGSITSVPIGIDCGSDCSEIYDANTQVTLSAAVDSGSIFEGWVGGGCAGTGNCVSDLTEETKIVAIISLEGSCGHGDELLLENVDADADNTLQACSSVTVGNGVNIVAPSTVELIAGDYVELTGEFAVASGAVLSIQTGP